MSNVDGLQIDVDQNCAVGAIAWYCAYAPGGIGLDGHVAYVNSYDDLNGIACLSEYNAQGLDGLAQYCQFGTRTINVNSKVSEALNRIPTAYIHVEKLVDTKAVEEKSSLRIATNPAINTANIAIANTTGYDGLLLIYDVRGQIRYQQTVTGSTTVVSVNVSAWSDGVYSALLITNDGNNAQRFQVLK